MIRYTGVIISERVFEVVLNAVRGRSARLRGAVGEVTCFDLGLSVRGSNGQKSERWLHIRQSDRSWYSTRVERIERIRSMNFASDCRGRRNAASGRQSAVIVT